MTCIFRGSRLSVAPAAAVRWLRDIYSNSIAVLTFEESSQRLCVASEVDVELYDDNGCPTLRLSLQTRNSAA
jgi:hypothetical protein